MRRREFITLLGGTVAAWPLAARGQPAALPVIGFLRDTSLADATHLVVAFRQGLKEAGFVEGQNVVIEYRSAEDQAHRLPALMAERATHPNVGVSPPVTRRFREASLNSRPLPGHRQGRGASTPAEGLTCFFKAVPSAIRVFAEFGELLEQISRAALVAGAAGRPRGAEHGAVAIGLLVQDRLVLL
jgi:hypothetical protein